MSKEKKEPNLLDKVKQVDKEVRARLVHAKLADMKKWAKEVLVLKEKTQVMLEELGVETKDIKRLIDYVNEQVKLTEKNKDEILSEVKEDLEESREDVEERMRDSFTGFAAKDHVYAMSATTAWPTDNNSSASQYTLTSGDSSVDFSVK